MKSKSPFSGFMFIIIVGIGLAWARSAYADANIAKSAIIAAIFIVIALVISSAIKIADPWDKAVVLRVGHFKSLRGAGLLFIVPVIDTIPYWIDTRLITTSFKAGKTLTKDTVLVDVCAVLFWKVLDPKNATPEVADYLSAISWASQTASCNVIGKTMLSDTLEGSDKISNTLKWDDYVSAYQQCLMDGENTIRG